MNKYVVFLFANVFFFGMTSCNNATDKEKDEAIDATTVPEAVLEHFENSFEKSTEVVWFMEDSTYEVEFMYKEAKTSAVYAANADLLELEVEINKDQLPDMILVYLAENYPDVEIEEIEKVMNNEGNFYEVEIEKDDTEISLFFTPEGDFVKEEIEQED